MDEDLEEDQRTQIGEQQLQGDGRMQILNEDVLDGTQPGMRTDSLKRIITAYMTKYERACVISTRALQIAMRELKERRI
ncbi:unnamed protein product [Rotaria sp. Silwood2]|nr:unnamed protein product [Rotaria sp. Silwood2]CAF3083356.1 unnamed protein product [Rotaria sp. Silwood2]